MGIKPSTVLIRLIDQFYALNSDITLVSVSTSDGFVIHQSSDKRFEVEPDKISAIASTFSSISNSIASEILESSFDIAFIETKKGNFVCIHTNYLKHDVVLTVFANDSMSLGTLRVKSREFGVVISKVPT
jgi:predicted regulator of Ras-like GTPase activity (Roadblock/LC7/MglB family)